MITNIYLDPSQQTKCLSNVTIGEQTVNVYWWYNSSKYGDDYLYAEAYKALGNIQGAIDLLQPQAQGTLTIIVHDDGDTYYKEYNDTRNWQQNWLDNNT